MKDVDVELVQDLYYNQLKSKNEIVKILGVSLQTLNRSLKRHDIKIKIRSHKRKNLVREKFGRLEVIKFVGINKHGRTVWLCRCECGKEKEIWAECLGKYTFSCGCMKKEKAFKGYKEIGNMYWKSVRRSALKRNIEMKVSIEDIWNKFIEQNRKCALSGIELKFIKNKESQTASLDRKDSTKGYTIDNIQWVHKDVNKMKTYFTDEYFIKICTQICNYRGNNGLSAHGEPV